MSWERASSSGPMKWVPPPPSSPAGADGSPTPSYATASSTSAPSTPFSNNSHGSYYHNSNSGYNNSPSSIPSTTSPQQQQHSPNQTAAAAAVGRADNSSSYNQERHQQHQIHHPLEYPSLGRSSSNSVPAKKPSSSSSSSMSSSASGYQGGDDRGSDRRQTDDPSPAGRGGRSNRSPPATANLPCPGAVPDEDRADPSNGTSTARALELLERTVEERNRFGGAAGAVPRGKKGKRQCASQLRALSLFAEQYSPGAGADDRGENDGTEEGGSLKDGEAGVGETVNDLKSEIDKIRQRGAGMRALSLLHATAAGEKHLPAPAPTTTKSPAGAAIVGGGAAAGRGGMTARRAAQLAHEMRQKEKEEVKAKLRKDLETYGRRVPKLVVPARTEKMAETTRKTKSATDDDVRDPETVSGMKCQLHWDREKEAQARALKLLNEGSGTLIAML